MSKGQSRIGSLIEAGANIVVGVAVSFISQLIIFNCFGIHISLARNAEMTAWFTAVSLLRQFCLRRFFNHLTIRNTPVEWVNIARDGRPQDNNGYLQFCKRKH